MPLHIGRVTWPAVVLLAGVALAVASSVFSFESASETPGVVPPRTDAAAPRTRRPELPSRPRPPDDAAPATVTREPLSERVDAVATIPPELVARSPAARRREMEVRLAAVADARGWSPSQTADIERLLDETLSGVESRLEGVTSPRAWARARRDLTPYRQEQARRIAEALGDEDYAAFAAELGVSRIPSPTGQPGIRWMARRAGSSE